MKHEVRFCGNCQTTVPHKIKITEQKLATTDKCVATCIVCKNETVTYISKEVL